jgi:hypothetical protein
MGVLIGTIIWIITIVASLYYINKYVGEQSNHSTPHIKAANQKYYYVYLELLYLL